VIPTPRLVLRKLIADDLDALVALDSDPDVMRFISGGAATPREAYVERLLPRMLAHEEPRVGYFAALEQGAFVGWFHLRPSVADASFLEVGYRLRRSAWGRGLATEGARALCAVAFDEHRVATVDACALSDNAASIAVMRKCGMTRRGRFRHPNAPVDVEHYAVDRAAFAGGARPCTGGS
jgi:RimJ/RimL family protein N-acetyltransferase